MSIAEKLTRIAENENKVYEAGYEKGKAEGGGGSYDQGYADGKKAEYDLFWDNFQQNGNCHYYDSAFRGDFFNDANYNPKYPIIASDTYGASYMYMNNKRLTDTKVTVSVPGLGNGMVFYQASRLKRIPTLEISDKTTFSNWFAGCSALEELNIVGEIAQNEFDVHWSTKLSRDSIVSVVNALSPTTTGLTVTLSKTAVESVFENNRVEIPFGFTPEQEGANVTFTDNGDGTATMNGTLEYDTFFYQGQPSGTFKAGAYKISLHDHDDGRVEEFISIFDLDGNNIGGFSSWSHGDEVAFSTDKDFIVKSRIFVAMGSYSDKVIAYPTVSENLIKYPYVSSEIQIDSYGYIRSNSDGTIVIDTQDCWSTGMYNFRLCTLTLPAGRYKMASAANVDIDLYGDELSFDVVDTATEEILFSTNGSNGSYEFTLTEEKEVTFTYLFNMLTVGCYYTVTPSLVRIDETNWDALAATKPNWTIALV